MAKAPARWDMEADVVVVGSGSGALSGALRTHDLGGKAIVLEKASKLGGGTAYSGGSCWIPNNHLMAKLGIKDSREEALLHLRTISGGKHDEEVLQAFVDNGPRVVQYLEEKAGVLREVQQGFTDYYPERPGGKLEGRFLSPLLFDAKKLGPWQHKVRTSPHIPYPTLDSEVRQWGGSLLVQNWDWTLIGKRVQEDIRGSGSAYICYLVKACLDRKINILVDTPARELYQDDSGRVVGVRAEQAGRSLNIRAKRGVLLACGGYEWNEEFKGRHPSPHYWGRTPPSNEGDGHIMALELGAAMVWFDHNMNPAIRIPGEEHDGKPLYRVNVQMSGAPGMIAVNRKGKRFYNESFWRACTSAVCHFDAITQTYLNVPCYAIFDQWHKDRYPLGPVMPDQPTPGWVHRAPTLRELAENLGIDPDGLEETMAFFNKHAQEGKDPVFHRGESAFDRNWSDPRVKPNPCLYPIEKPPFYGIEIQLASGGGRGGVAINGKAQVKNVRGELITGLYACPNVAAHLVEGMAYNSGLCNGESTVFGFVAAEHAMGTAA